MDHARLNMRSSGPAWRSTSIRRRVVPQRVARTFLQQFQNRRILREKLDDPETAAEYLTACCEEGPEVFLVGLRDVAEAQGGVARAAELTKLNRESLYRFFPVTATLVCRA